MDDHRLILECYHPSTKLTTPYLFCDYIGTDGLSDDVSDDTSGSLGKLADLYSHFRPIPAEERRPSRRWRSIVAPQSPSEPLSRSLVDEDEVTEPAEEPLASHNISLESYELFSQLCTVTSLIKVGPKPGLFLSCVNISEGVTRVWRNWLSEQAESYRKTRRIALLNKSKARVIPENVREQNFENLLWADPNKHVGLRLRVKQRNDTSMPILMHRDDDDEPVSYTLEYEGKIRTTSAYLGRIYSLLSGHICI